MCERARIKERYFSKSRDGIHNNGMEKFDGIFQMFFHLDVYDKFVFIKKFIVLLH